jgi:hypothetical protein
VTPAQRGDLLLKLSDLEANGGPCGQGTGPVTIQLGYVAANNICTHDGIVLIDAPAAVLTAVLAWVAAQDKTTYVSASVVQYQSGPVSRTSGVLIR